jgi:hypothetical protein
MRIPIEGGGSILVEADSAAAGGPVKAGRLGDVVEDAASTLQAALVPIKDATRAVLEQLQDAGPHEIEVSFGVELTAQAGAVIMKAESGCHLAMKLTWKNDSSNARPAQTRTL